jgi:hypothetical protein
MKKLFGLAGVVLFFGTSLSVNAQTSRVNSSETPSQPETNVTAAVVTTKYAKAERDFNKNYKTATGAEWYDTYNGGSVVYFTEGDTKMKSAYNKKGKWEYTLRFYDQKEVSAETRSMVISNYPDYSIMRAIEVERFNKKVLLVYIENAKNLKTARIMDGEMDIVEEYRKSK